MNTPTQTTATGDILNVRRCRLGGVSHYHPPTCHTITLLPSATAAPIMVEHWASEIAAHRRADVLLNLATEHVNGEHEPNKADRRRCLGCGDEMDRRALLCRDCMKDLRDGDTPTAPLPIDGVRPTERHLKVIDVE